MAFAIFMGFIVSAFMTFFGNKIAQKIMPTFENDSNDRQYAYSALARVIGIAGFLGLVGLFYMAIKLKIIE